jgi:hypothetical protein
VTRGWAFPLLLKIDDSVPPFFLLAITFFIPLKCSIYVLEHCEDYKKYGNRLGCFLLPLTRWCLV